MSLLRRAGTAVAAVASAAGLLAAPATAVAAEQPVTASQTFKFTAALVKPGAQATSDDPPLFTCEWTATAGHPSGGVDPLTYEATFNCGPGPDPLADIQAKLYSSKGVLEHVAPKEGPYFNQSVTSKNTFYGARANQQHYIRTLSRVELIMGADGQVWYFVDLPAGCTGVATPVAECDLKSNLFT